MFFIISMTFNRNVQVLGNPTVGCRVLDIQIFDMIHLKALVEFK
jgi:hypothetical protein